MERRRTRDPETLHVTRTEIPRPLTEKLIGEGRHEGDVGEREGGEYLRSLDRSVLPDLGLEPADPLPVHQEGEAGGQGGPRVLGGHQHQDPQPAGALEVEGDRHHGVEMSSWQGNEMRSDSLAPTHT